MPHSVKLENIEALRGRAGIHDDELEKKIRHLRVGDHVKITFLMSSSPGRSETVQVRITSVEGGSYRGKLTEDLTTLQESDLRSGSLVTFDSRHIHSIAKAEATN